MQILRLERLTLVLLVFGVLAPGIAFAHARGEDYVFVNFREGSLDGEFQINVEDLRAKLGLEIPDDPTAARAAVVSTAGRVQDYISAHFAIGPVDGEPYVLEFDATDLLDAAPEYAKYQFHASSGPLPEALVVEHRMLYEDDSIHRGLLLVQYNAKTGRDYGEEYTALVFGPRNSRQILSLVDVPGLVGRWEMIWQGVLHIWMGIDHVLFLVALLLSTVLIPNEIGWTPVPRFRTAFFKLLQIVTVFTLAHSVTLVLAALDIVDLQSRFVESVIALSIVLVALNNISRTVKEGSLAVVLVLGLFHGLGFATVMGQLPFRMGDLLRMTIRFNIGVELGQLAIVVVLFPILYALRRSPYYVPAVLTGGSSLLIVIAGYWFVQRAFALG